MDIVSIIGNPLSFELTPKYNFYVSFINTWAQMLQNYRTYITNYPEDDSLASIGASISQIGLNVKDTMFIVKAVDAPEISVDSEDIDIGTTKINSPKGLNVNGDLLIDFFPESKNLVKKLYYNWLILMFKKKDNTKRPRNLYEADIDIYIYDRINQQIEHKTCHGCSPRSLEKQRLDVLATDYLESIPITFNVNNGITIE